MIRPTHHLRTWWTACPLVALSLIASAVHAQTVTLNSGETSEWTSGTLTGDVVFNGSNTTFTVGPQAQLNGNVRLGNSSSSNTVLNFAGQANFIGTLGTSTDRLTQVTFNSAGTGQTVMLRTDVWAGTTMLGNSSTSSVNSTNVTVLPLSGGGLTFGGDLALNNANTTVDIGKTRNVVQGDFKTSGGTLLYVLSPNTSSVNITSSLGTNLDVQNGVGSGQVSANRLVIAGGETFSLNLTGSLRNGATYDLITSSSAAQGLYSQDESSGRVQDNSFVIDSSVALSADGKHLVYTASRTDNQYITKSQTEGHYANNAARTLGHIAAQGVQAGDLATVIERFDLDSYGYGNNATNLANNIKRLAPVANNSQTLTMLGVADAALLVLDDRLLHVRGEVPGEKTARPARLWAQPFQQKAQQTGVDHYDGYRSRTTGGSVGVEYPWQQGWWGLMGAIGSTSLSQLDFHSGDNSQISSALVGVNAGQDIGPLTVSGALSMGQFDIDSIRTTAQNRVAQSTNRLTYSDLRLDMSYRVKLKDGKSTISPTFGIQTSRLHQPDYAETGAGDLSLQVDGKNYYRTRAKVGVRFATEGRLAGIPSYTTFGVTARHDMGLSNMDVSARYSGPTDSSVTGFVTPAYPVNNTSLLFSGALTLALSKSASLQARLDLEHRLGYVSQGVSIRALQTF